MSSIRPCFLLVDDHALFRTGLGLVLSQHWPQGQVIQAATWGEGLCMAQQCQPDLILLDVHLPDGHGLNDLPALQALVPRCPVLLMSAQTDVRLVQAARDGGAAGFLPKSASTGEVLAAARSALSGQAAFAAVPYASLVPPALPASSGVAFSAGGAAASSALRAGSAPPGAVVEAALKATFKDTFKATRETTLKAVRGANTPAGLALEGDDALASRWAVSEPELALTARQRDILRYLGRGTPNKAIARQMGMSETDVRAEVSWLTEWLGAASREEAHAQALARGLIQP